MASTVTRSTSSLGVAAASWASVVRRSSAAAALPAGERSSRSSSPPGTPRKVALMGLRATAASK